MNAAFLGSWKTPKPYRVLVAASVIGFVVSVVLHNVFYAVGEWLDVPALVWSAQAASVVFFYLAVVLCPPVFLIALVGLIVTSIMERRGTDGRQDAEPDDQEGAEPDDQVDLKAPNE